MQDVFRSNGDGLHRHAMSPCWAYTTMLGRAKNGGKEECTRLYTMPQYTHADGFVDGESPEAEPPCRTRANGFAGTAHAPPPLRLGAVHEAHELADGVSSLCSKSTLHPVWPSARVVQVKSGPQTRRASLSRGAGRKCCSLNVLSRVLFTY